MDASIPVPNFPLHDVADEPKKWLSNGTIGNGGPAIEGATVGEELNPSIAGNRPSLKDGVQVSGPDIDEPIVTQALQRHGSGQQTETISASAPTVDRVGGLSDLWRGGLKHSDTTNNVSNDVTEDRGVPRGTLPEPSHPSDGVKVAVPQRSEMVEEPCSVIIPSPAPTLELLSVEGRTDNAVPVGLDTASAFSCAVSPQEGATLNSNDLGDNKARSPRATSGNLPPILVTGDNGNTDIVAGAKKLPADGPTESICSCSKKIGDALRLVPVAEIRRFSKFQLLANMTKGDSNNLCPSHWSKPNQPTTRHDGSYKEQLFWNKSNRYRTDEEDPSDQNRYTGVASWRRRLNYSSGAFPTYYSSNNKNYNYQNFDKSDRRMGWNSRNGVYGHDCDSWYASSMTRTKFRSNQSSGAEYYFNCPNASTYNSRRWRWSPEGAIAGPVSTSVSASSALFVRKERRKSDIRPSLSPYTKGSNSSGRIYQQPKPLVPEGQPLQRPQKVVIGNRGVSSRGESKCSTFAGNCKIGGRNASGGRGSLWPAWVNSNSGPGIDNHQSYLAASPNYLSPGNSSSSSNCSSSSTRNSGTSDCLKSRVSNRPRGSAAPLVIGTVWSRRQRNNDWLTFPDTASLGGGPLFDQSVNSSVYDVEAYDEDDEDDEDGDSDERVEAGGDDFNNEQANSSAAVGEGTCGRAADEKNDGAADEKDSQERPQQSVDGSALLQASGNTVGIKEGDLVQCTDRGERYVNGGNHHQNIISEGEPHIQPSYHKFLDLIHRDNNEAVAVDYDNDQLANDKVLPLGVKGQISNGNSYPGNADEQVSQLFRPPPSISADDTEQHGGASKSRSPFFVLQRQTSRFLNSTESTEENLRNMGNSTSVTFSEDKMKNKDPPTDRSGFQQSHTSSEGVLPFPYSTNCNNVSICSLDMRLRKGGTASENNTPGRVEFFAHQQPISEGAMKGRSRRGARSDATTYTIPPYSEKRSQWPANRWRGGRCGSRGSLHPVHTSHNTLQPRPTVAFVTGRIASHSSCAAGMQTRSSPKVFPVSQNVIDYRLRQLAIAKCSTYYQRYARAVDVSQRTADQPQTPRADSSSTCGMFTMQLLAWRHRVRQEAERLLLAGEDPAPTTEDCNRSSSSSCCGVVNNNFDSNHYSQGEGQIGC